MKKKCSALIFSLLLALALCMPAAAMGTDYGQVYDETDLLGSDALKKLGEDILPALSEQLGVYIQVDVLTDWAEGNIAGDAEYLYDQYEYGYGEDCRGLTLTLGVTVDGETVALGPDDWFVYVGGTDAQLTGSGLNTAVANAAAPYLAPKYWSGDLDVTRNALAQAVNAMAGTVKNTLSGSDGPLTDLTGGLLASAPGVTYDPTYIYDIANLLSYKDWSALEEQAGAISERYDCGVYAAIVDDYTAYGSGSVSEVAQRIFRDNDFGLGQEQNGVLLLLSVAGRDYSVYASGKTGEYAFSSYAREQLADEFLDAFGRDDWAGGMSDYITACGDYLDRAANGKPVGESPVYGIAFGTGIGCFVAFVVCMFQKRKMKSVHKGALASEYVAAGGLTLTDSYDHYTHTTETRRTIETKSGGSGSDGGAASGKF